MRPLKKLRRLPASRVVVVSLAILALSVAMVGCDGSGGGDSSTATTSGTPTGVTQPTAGLGAPEGPAVVQATDLRGFISGRVVDSTTGVPVPGATVTAGAGVGSATTDGLGNFTLANAFLSGSNTPIILTVTNASLLGSNYPSLTNAVVSLAGDGGIFGAVVPTNVVANVEIELHDQKGYVTGTLLDTTGKPVVGAVIIAKPNEIPVITPGVVDAANPGTGIFPFPVPSVTPAPGGLIGQSVATSDSTGKFTLANLPVNWLYDITIIPGPGIPNLIFTNQYIPGKSGFNCIAVPTGITCFTVLAFPDTVGAPVDSAVTNAFSLAGAGAFSLAAGCPGGCGAFIPGAPVIVGVPAADGIAPFLLVTSDPVDGTVYSDGLNQLSPTVPQKPLFLRFNEVLAQGNNNDVVRSFIQLRYLGFSAATAVAPGDLIPTKVDVLDNGATIRLIPEIPGKLAPGLYEITGLANLSDGAGNKYTGVRPTGLLPPSPFPGTPDAASAPPSFPAGGVPPVGAVILPPGLFDGKVSFAILEPIAGVQVGSVTGITCSAGACNNGTTLFNVTFGAAASAVQYFAGFATGQAPNTPLIPTIIGPGGVFASAGPLFDPPEFVAFNLTTAIGTNGVGVPITLQGFGFPLVGGTEGNGQIANNYFDDGVSYIVAVEGQSMAGIRGPQVVSLTIRDNTAPGLNTTFPGVGPAPAPGLGNNFNARLDPLNVAAGLVTPLIATVNRTTPFTILDNVFSTSAAAETMGDSIPLAEGVAGAPGTVGYDFANVTAATADVSVFGADIVYSAADYTSAAMITSATISIAANEDLCIPGRTIPTICPAATLIAPTVSPVGSAGLTGLFTNGGGAIPGTAIGSAAQPAGVVNPTGTIGVPTIVNDGDGLADENVIALTLGDPRNFRTGDLVSFAGTGITDEADRAIAATVRVANGIPAAITSAVASVSGTNHVLTLNFDRPVTFEGGAVAANMLVASLGLRNLDGTFPAAVGTVPTGTAAIAANERSLTVTIPFDPTMGLTALQDVTNQAVVDGLGLQTDDPLAFIGALGIGVAGSAYFVGNASGGFPFTTPSFLGVNTFQVASTVGNGRAAILVTDSIPPRITAATAAVVATGVAPALNAAAGGAVANGVWEVGDIFPAGDAAYSVTLTFSEPVFAGTVGALSAASLADAQARVMFALSLGAGSTAAYTLPATNPITSATADMVTIMFGLGGGTVAVGDTFTVTVTDLAGTTIDPGFNDVALLAATTGVMIQ